MPTQPLETGHPLTRIQAQRLSHLLQRMILAARPSGAIGPMRSPSIPLLARRAQWSPGYGQASRFSGQGGRWTDWAVVRRLPGPGARALTRLGPGFRAAAGWGRVSTSFGRTSFCAWVPYLGAITPFFGPGFLGSPSGRQGPFQRLLAWQRDAWALVCGISSPSGKVPWAWACSKAPVMLGLQGTFWGPCSGQGPQAFFSGALVGGLGPLLPARGCPFGGPGFPGIPRDGPGFGAPVSLSPWERAPARPQGYRFGPRGEIAGPFYKALAREQH